jgi:hypothetical protein
MSDNPLINALLSPQDPSARQSCKFIIVRGCLTEEEQQALDKAVEGIRQDAGIGKAKRFSATWLAKVLRSFGHDVSVSTIQRHVNKECSCERISQ